MSQVDEKTIAPVPSLADVGTILDEAVVWKYNGQSYTLDMSDEEDVQRFQKCAAALSEREGQEGAEGIGPFCENMRKLFDDLFGEGEGNNIVGARNNMRLAIKAYAGICDFVTAQGKAMEAVTAIAKQAAIDNLNRQQKRAVDRKKKG